MKMRAIASAIVFLAATAGSAYASCDVRKMYTDEQAMCASKCEDAFIRDKQQAELVNAAKADTNKKACDTACGCAANSK